MSDSKISFEYLEVEAWDLRLDTLSDWLLSVAFNERQEISNLLYIFCTDEYLYLLNRAHLKHNTYTDVITFPESYNPISAEIYISLDRVAENAILHGEGQTMSELHRVILHGLLHMCGYNDKTEKEQSAMREKEDEYLAHLLM